MAPTQTQRSCQTAEGDHHSSVKDLTSTSWGYLIAFLLPGVLGIYALSFWFPELGVMLQPIKKADATVGPSVVLLLIAVGVGLCLSAARYFVLQKRLYKKKSLSDAFNKTLTPEKLAVLRAYAEEHYRYHQFYGGCFIAVLILYTGWLHGQWPFKGAIPHALLVTAGFILLECLLERSSYDAFEQYIDKCNAQAPSSAGIGKGAGR